MQPVTPDPKILVEIVNTRIPFGKYKDTFLSDLPVHYLEWFSTQGFPPGKLGMMLSTVFEIKTNGLSEILAIVKANYKTTPRR